MYSTPEKPHLEAFRGYYVDSGSILGESSPPIPPIMEKIAFCESSNNPDAINHNTNGTIDVGIFQINSIHHDRAQEMGYNIENKEDNIAFALYLYEEQGTQPWRASQECWLSL